MFLEFFFISHFNEIFIKTKMTFHKLCKKCKMFIQILYCFLCFADMLIYLGLFGVCSLLDIELNLKKTRQKQHLYWEH